MDKIKVQDLHKSFEHKVVLEGINLDVKEGESVVIIGASGAGKSVLLNNILGILEPKSEKGLQNDQKSIRFIDKTHMACRHVEKPYKTCRKRRKMEARMSESHKDPFLLLKRRKKNKIRKGL